MNYSVKNDQPNSHPFTCTIIAILTGSKLSPSAQALNKASHQQLQKLIKTSGFRGELGQTLMLYHVPNLKTERILLVGCGDPKKLTESKFRAMNLKMACALRDSNTKDALSYLTEVDVNKRDTTWKVQQSIECIEECLYRFDELKSEKNSKKSPLTKIAFYNDENISNAKINKAISQTKAICSGMQLTKDLGNLPGNICTPTYLAKQAKNIAKHYPAIKTTILEEAQMKKLGMGALLSVAQGSDQPAKLICMQYHGAKATQKPVALVGKGVTFDSGGISLKPGEAMDEMKYDMCGAGTVFGTMKAIAELKLPINVVGVIAASENLPGGSATKPGDIVKTMSGQTIEILNTDAEGRLVLSDAITYSKKFKPTMIIDIATLTGAMVIALGHEACGVFTNHDPLAKNLVNAGQQSWDRSWQMPMWEDYQPLLDSNFADMANIGGRWGGSITAACFLSRFAGEIPWAHLDIAGVAWKSGKEKGATGRPVPLLTQFLIDQCKK